MLRIALIFLFFAVTFKSVAQETIPFEFTSADENRLIRENDSLKFYAATDDTNNIVVLNEEALWYKLTNKDHKVLAEGAYISEGDKYLQDGKWVARYDNGKIRMVRYYRRSMPVGTWQEFYNTGKLKSVSNYGLFAYKTFTGSCLSGTWQEYYPGGRLKVNGLYIGSLIAQKDTISVDDPVGGQKVNSVVSRYELRAEKTGRWEYYTEAGELDRNEDN